MPEPKLPEIIPITRLRLSRINPRHEPVEEEKDAIAVLMKDERVRELADDIAKLGTSNMENLGVVKNKNGKTYTVIEGNRRACALMLLNDPTKAPSTHRPFFQDLKARHDIQKTVLVSVYAFVADVEPWLDRMHDGENNGIGRRQWDALRKARRDPKNENRRAYVLIAYSVDNELTTFATMAGAITTVQRFIGNPRLRKLFALEFDPTETTGIKFERSKADSNKLIERMLAYLSTAREGDPLSRMNSNDIVTYARGLLADLGLPEDPNDTDVDDDEGPSTGSPNGNNGDGGRDGDGDGGSGSDGDGGGDQEPEEEEPASPFVRKSNRLVKDTRIIAALQKLSNYKLTKLYNSMTSVPLEQHTMMLYVGAWSFLESLTSLTGRKDGVNFPSYINSQYQSLGLATDKYSKAPVGEALERIRVAGNTNKHHRIAASLNKNQFNNDIEVLSEVILACIKRARDIEATKTS